MGSIIFVLVLVVFTAIVAGVIWLFKQNDEVTTDKEGKKTDLFEKKIRSFYIYLVVIICLFTLVFGVVQVFRSTLDVLLPQQIVASGQEDPRNVEINKQNTINQQKIDLISNIATIVVVLPILIYHSRLIRQVSKEV